VDEEPEDKEVLLVVDVEELVIVDGDDVDVDVDVDDDEQEHELNCWKELVIVDNAGGELMIIAVD